MLMTIMQTANAYNSAYNLSAIVILSNIIRFVFISYIYLSQAFLLFHSRPIIILYIKSLHAYCRIGVDVGSICVKKRCTSA